MGNIMNHAIKKLLTGILLCAGMLKATAPGGLRSMRDDFTPPVISTGAATMGSDINSQDEKGRTILFYACSADMPNLEQIQDLLALGANPNVSDLCGATCFYKACENFNSSFDVIECLREADATLNSGQSVNHRTCHGYSPLFWLCNQNRLDTSDEALESYDKIIRLLLYGAIVDAKTIKMVLQNKSHFSQDFIDFLWGKTDPLLYVATYKEWFADLQVNETPVLFSPTGCCVCSDDERSKSAWGICRYTDQRDPRVRYQMLLDEEAFKVRQTLSSPGGFFASPFSCLSPLDVATDNSPAQERFVALLKELEHCSLSCTSSI